MNERTAVGKAVGPIQLKAALFRPKPDEIEAQLDFHCDEGKDQLVTYEVVILGARGTPVLTLRETRGIEETDDKTFRKSQKVPFGLLDSVHSFNVNFSSVPD